MNFSDASPVTTRCLPYLHDILYKVCLMMFFLVSSKAVFGDVNKFVTNRIITLH